MGAAMKISVVGIDLGKQTFHIHGVDDTGKVIVQKKLTRSKLQAFMLNLEPCLVGMEACAGAHHWARLLARAWRSLYPVIPATALRSISPTISISLNTRSLARGKAFA